MAKDPYEVLGVAKGAPLDEVKKAYRKKAREYHPDLHPGDDEAARKMNEVNEAYDRIMNPGKYAASDRRAAQARGKGTGAAYGGAGGYGGQGGASRGSGQGGYSSGGPYGWTGWDFDDLFGYGWQGDAAAGPIHPEPSPSDSPEMRSAINDINAGRYQAAISTLNRMVSFDRDARWHYVSALANDGAGNTLTALEQIRRAVRMDPENADYQRAQRSFQRAGQAYRQESADQGFTVSSMDPSTFCCGCLALNMGVNMCIPHCL